MTHTTFSELITRNIYLLNDTELVNLDNLIAQVNSKVNHQSYYHQFIRVKNSGKFIAQHFSELIVSELLTRENLAMLKYWVIQNYPDLNMES